MIGEAILRLRVIPSGGVCRKSEQTLTENEEERRAHEARGEGEAVESWGRFSTLGSSKSGRVVADAIDISRATAKSGPALAAAHPSRCSGGPDAIFWRSASCGQLSLQNHAVSRTPHTHHPNTLASRIKMDETMSGKSDLYHSPFATAYCHNVTSKLYVACASKHSIT
jgi:hypothetical protein